MLSKQAKLVIMATKDAIKTALRTEGRMKDAAFYGRIQALRDEEDEELYHPNQDETACKVTDLILNDENMIFQMVVARTQAGKTGCMVAVIEKCFESENPSKRINPSEYLCHYWTEFQ